MAGEDARRQGDRRLRAVRAALRLRCRQHGHDRRARRRRLSCSTARRPGSPTAASPTSTSSSRAPARRPAPRASPPSSCRPTRTGLDVAERLEVIAPHPLARLALRRRARAGIGADRQAGRRLPHRHVGARRVPLDRRRGGARLCPPRARRERSSASRERKLFGAPMAELQMVQGHIADMALDVDAAALLVYRAAWTKDMGAARVTREAAMAKLFATDRAQVVIDKAVQLHGGDGVRSGSHRRAPLSRDPRAAHLRRRVRRAEGRDRPTGLGGGMMMLGPSAHIDTFARDNLPPPDAVAGLPARRLRLSRAPQRRRRADRPHGRAGLRRQHRADRQRPPAHLQGAVRLDQPAGACAGRGPTASSPATAC